MARRLATLAGVSRGREPRRRDETSASANPPPAEATAPDQRASADSPRQELRGYRDEIARLQPENRSLKEQLARQLGQRPAAITRPS
ncbi:MAG: hypothetical protein ACRDZU_14745 [Acidimicrobiales bacterium]